MRTVVLVVALAAACGDNESPPPDAAVPSCTFPEAACGAPTCANLLEDPLNCGACGTVCTAEQRCVAGACLIGGNAGVTRR